MAVPPGVFEGVPSGIQRLAGSYTLESFEIEDLEGARRPWGVNIRGLLIYTVDGHMSVSINKDVEPVTAEESEFEALFDSILFYAGTYTVEGDLIRHQVTQASNPARIGKEMLRYAEWSGSTVTLSTPKEPFGRAILAWKRVGA
jgi:hypothetical protein